MDVDIPVDAPVAADYPKDAIALGNLVQAAYDMSKHDTDLNPPISENFPSGYKITHSVVMDDDGIPTFYGFIAQKTDQTDRYFLIIRGTIGLREWISDLESTVPTWFYTFGKVGSGFAKVYYTIHLRRYHYGAQLTDLVEDSDSAKRPFARQVADALVAHAATSEFAASAPPRLSVAGHSLGSALATLYAVERLTFSSIPIDTFCTFASPHVGDADFASAFAKLTIPTTYRIYNDYDIVPKLPPSWLVDFVPVGEPRELFLNTSYWCSDPACSHPLSTYLHCLAPSQYSPAPACTNPLSTASAELSPPPP